MLTSLVRASRTSETRSARGTRNTCSGSGPLGASGGRVAVEAAGVVARAG